MSNPNNWEAQIAICESKIGYGKFHMADKVARAQNRRGVPVRPYECPVCGQWHNTSQQNGRLGKRKDTRR